MTKISFIYFDVGGVVVKDYSASNKWVEMQCDLGVTPELENKFEELWNAHTQRVCLDYDVDNFTAILRRDLGLKIPESYSMLEDFISRFETNESIWPAIQHVQSLYPTGLITNMYPRMLALIKANNLFPSVDWDIVIDSSLELVKKSDPAIYQLATDRAGVPKEEILFVENSKKHIDGASDFGFQTFFYDSSDYVQSSSDLLTFVKTHV